MQRLVTFICILAGTILLIASTAFSATPPDPHHNRGIQNVSFVPGSGRGVWKVQVDWYAQTDSVGVPVDLGFHIGISVNDEVVEQLVQPVVFTPVFLEARCPDVEYFTMEACINACTPFRCGEFMLGSEIIETDYCNCFGFEDFPETHVFCDCFFFMSAYSSEFTLLPGDRARATIVPNTGAFQEWYFNDDSLEDTLGCCQGSYGNVDGDPSDQVNVADLTYLVDYLFRGGPAPPCFEEGDVDGDGNINVADLTYLVDYLFRGGPAPPPC